MGVLDLEAIRAQLKARAGELARRYLGKPNRAMSTRAQLRFGAKGSLAVEIAGDKAGVWWDFGADEGGDLLDLIRRERGCGFVEALDEAVKFVGGCAAPVPARAKAASPDPADKQRKIDLAIKILNESWPIKGTLGETYLKRRGLFVPDGVDLRFHPRCPRGQDRVPAMIAPMRSIATGEITAIHRTYIAPDGSKAKLHEDDKAKKMLGRAAGAAVMLDGFDTVTGGLFISEGIENGLVARCLGWAPVWALGSAGAMACFDPLSGVEALTILADPGERGGRAARACAEQWIAAGAEVRVVQPRGDGDWNVALRAWRVP